MVIKLKQLSSDEHDYDCCRTSQKLGGGQPLPRLVPARRYTIILHTQAPAFFSVRMEKSGEKRSAANFFLEQTERDKKTHARNGASFFGLRGPTAVMCGVFRRNRQRTPRCDDQFRLY